MMPHWPFFSIVIATYNRPQQLAHCLQALSQLDYPRDRFEVIVVDDGSRTPPEKVIAIYCNRFTVTLLTHDHAGPASARNAGVAQAKGEFIVFTDDDCAPVPDYLQKLVERFVRTPDCAIGGRTINALTDNLYSTASQLLMDYLYSSLNAAAPRFFASNNLALPRALFQKIGGFDASYPRAAAEDREFCDRWLSCGYRMIYAPEALIYHAHALALRAFVRQHFTYGRGAFRFRRACARQNREPLKLEPSRFYWNLLRSPFALKSGKRVLFLAALLFVSQVANAAGFFWEVMAQRWKK